MRNSRDEITNDDISRCQIQYHRLVHQIARPKMKLRRARIHSVQPHLSNRIIHNRAFLVACGISIGFLISYLTHSFTGDTDHLAKYRVPRSFNVTYYSWMGEQQLADEQRRASANHRTLAKEVRVLCWVLTNPLNHYVKAIHVKNTWGKRCTLLLLMSTEEGKTIFIVRVFQILAIQFSFLHHNQMIIWARSHCLWWRIASISGERPRQLFVTSMNII